jgi:hypothetical protein
LDSGWCRASTSPREACSVVCGDWEERRSTAARVTADNRPHTVQVSKQHAHRSGGPNYGSEGWGFESLRAHDLRKPSFVQGAKCSHAVWGLAPPSCWLSPATPHPMVFFGIVIPRRANSYGAGMRNPLRRVAAARPLISLMKSVNPFELKRNHSSPTDTTRPASSSPSSP